MRGETGRAISADRHALMRRPCIDCGVLVSYPENRCPACASRRNVARGGSTARGYGVAHQRARAALKGALPAPCGGGCGTPLYPDGDWVAAHVVDGQPEHGWIATCRSCNERMKRARVWGGGLPA